MLCKGRNGILKTLSKSFSPQATKLFIQSCHIIIHIILHGSSKGLGMKTHKDAYMFSFLIQDLLNIKKQNTLAMQGQGHSRHLAALGVCYISARVIFPVFTQSMCF